MSREVTQAFLPKHSNYRQPSFSFEIITQIILQSACVKGVTAVLKYNCGWLIRNPTQGSTIVER